MLTAHVSPGMPPYQSSYNASYPQPGNPFLMGYTTTSQPMNYTPPPKSVYPTIEERRAASRALEERRQRMKSTQTEPAPESQVKTLEQDLDTIEQRIQNQLTRDVQNTMEEYR